MIDVDYVLKVSIDCFVKDEYVLDEGIELLKDEGFDIFCVQHQPHSYKEEVELKRVMDNKRLEDVVKEIAIAGILNERISKKYNNILDYFKLLKKEGNMPEELFLNLKESLDYLEWVSVSGKKNPF